MAKRQNVVVQKALNRAEFRQGSGYSVTELQSVGLNIKEARNKGIRVDLRRKSTYEKNIEFLMGTYSLERQKVEIKPKTKVVKQAPKKVAPKKVAPKKETPAPKKETPAPKKETPAPKKETPAPKKKTPAPKKETPAPKKETPAQKKEKPKVAPKPVEKKATPKPAPKAAPVKKETAVKTPPKSKVITTEEFHKMYNDETGKNPIWRGKESGVYLKWLDKKKKDLGL